MKITIKEFVDIIDSKCLICSKKIDIKENAVIFCTDTESLNSHYFQFLTYGDMNADLGYVIVNFIYNKEYIASTFFTVLDELEFYKPDLRIHIDGMTLFKSKDIIKLLMTIITFS